MGKYLHMMPGDVAIWERFLSQHRGYFTKYDYDVHVGEGIKPDPGWEANIRKAAYMLTTKRIDVVAYRDNETWIIEVKPDAGMSALGQLIGYRDLWLKTFGPTENLILAIITDQLNPDEKFLFEKNNIKWYIV